ncbi:hypothetical protein EMIT0P44_30311 [Pseudomonas sp. IT-P44]
MRRPVAAQFPQGPDPARSPAVSDDGLWATPLTCRSRLAGDSDLKDAIASKPAPTGRGSRSGCMNPHSAQK